MYKIGGLGRDLHIIGENVICIVNLERSQRIIINLYGVSIIFSGVIKVNELHSALHIDDNFFIFFNVNSCNSAIVVDEVLCAMTLIILANSVRGTIVQTLVIFRKRQAHEVYRRGFLGY